MLRWMRSCQGAGWLVGHELTRMATGRFPRAARGQNQAGKQMSASDGECVGSWEDNSKRIGRKREIGIYLKGVDN